MKKILLLLVFLTSTHWLFAQRYDFDYYINYEWTYLDNVRDMQSLYNSKNAGYRVKFHVLSDSVIQALIIDSNVIHTFNFFS